MTDDTYVPRKKGEYWMSIANGAIGKGVFRVTICVFKAALCWETRCKAQGALFNGGKIWQFMTEYQGIGSESKGRGFAIFALCFYCGFMNVDERADELGAMTELLGYQFDWHNVMKCH